MRIFILILVILTLKRTKVSTEVCTKPDVKRSLIHIYQIVYNIDVKVYRCQYTGLHQYSDITDNCIKAFRSGVFIDKWDESNNAFGTPSNVALSQYMTKANLFKNEIKLKSGTTCRYDRGYCYDAKESTKYAVVWEVVKKIPKIGNSNFEQVFYGWVDIWRLKNNQLKYVVYQDSKKDKSFALQLSEKETILGKTIWYTDKFGLIVSELSLTPTKKSTPVLNEAYFPLESKQAVAESVMTSCDLQSIKFPLDFERQIDNNYITNPKSLKTILYILQKEIIASKSSSSNIKGGNGSSVDPNYVKLQKEVAETKKSLDEERADIEKIQNDLKNTENKLTQGDKDLAEIKDKVKNALDTINTKSTDFVKVKESSDDALKRIINLEQTFNIVKDDKEGYDKLKEYIDELYSKLSEKDDEILNTLNTTDDEIITVKNGLSDVLTKLKNRDEELLKEKEKILDKLSNLELTLDTKNIESGNCCNETKELLARNEEEFLLNINKVENKLLSQHMELSNKLNLTSDLTQTYVSNFSDVILSHERDISNIDIRVANAEKRIGENQKSLFNATNQIDVNRGDIESINDNITEIRDEVCTEISKLKDELVALKGQASEFKDNIETSISQNKDVENLRNNLTEVKIELDLNQEVIEDIKKNLTETGDKAFYGLNKISSELGSLKDQSNELKKNIQLAKVLQYKDLEDIRKNCTDTETKVNLNQKDIADIKKNLAETSDNASTGLNILGDELRSLKDQSDKFKNSVEATNTLQNKDLENVRNNLTEAQNRVTEGDNKIALLQSDVKDIFKKLESNTVDLTETVNTCQLYVNTRLKAKDEEINQIHKILIAKDKEISRLKENLHSITVKENHLEDEIKQCKEHTETLVNESNEELQRLLKIVINVDETVTAEKTQRDKEHEELKKKILELEELLSVPPAT